jgi:hypothetical protein
VIVSPPDPISTARRLAAGGHAASSNEYQRATVAVLLAIYDRLGAVTSPEAEAQNITPPPVTAPVPARRAKGASRG